MTFFVYGYRRPLKVSQSQPGLDLAKFPVSQNGLGGGGQVRPETRVFCMLGACSHEDEWPRGGGLFLWPCRSAQRSAVFADKFLGGNKGKNFACGRHPRPPGSRARGTGRSRPRLRVPLLTPGTSPSPQPRNLCAHPSGCIFLRCPWASLSRKSFLRSAAASPTARAG